MNSEVFDFSLLKMKPDFSDKEKKIINFIEKKRKILRIQINRKNQEKAKRIIEDKEILLRRLNEDTEIQLKRLNEDNEKQLMRLDRECEEEKQEKIFNMLLRMEEENL